MKDAGKTSASPPVPPNPENPEAAQRTIQAAPGDVSSSRPVTEPSDTTTR
jgi:sec-independent protein translocase protein TatA